MIEVMHLSFRHSATEDYDKDLDSMSLNSLSRDSPNTLCAVTTFARTPRRRRSAEDGVETVKASRCGKAFKIALSGLVTVQYSRIQ